MKRLAIIGAGESGVGAALLAHQYGYDILVSDFGSIKQSFIEELTKNNIRFEEGGHDFEWISKADIIVKSPGVPHRAGIIEHVINLGKSIISEIEFGFQYCQSKIIGITGSNGKTTTTQLVNHILTTAGYKVTAGGNLGKSFCRILSEDHQYDWLVLELSSFQLDDIQDFRADVAILLNITADHLDRYDYDIMAYANAKYNIIRNQKDNDIFIYNDDDSLIQALRAKEDIRNRKLPITDSCFGDDTLKTFSGLTFDLSDFSLSGAHNRFNAACAIECALAIGGYALDVQRALSTFRGEPHRMEHVALWRGIEFINDSKATNVDAVYYALDACDGDVVWIAGGTDKGNDYGPLLPLVKTKVNHLICLGLDNSKLVKTFSGLVDQIVEVNNTDDAVASAVDLASAHTVVLLSPACASFDLFQNYVDRGNQFKASVQRLIDD